MKLNLLTKSFLIVAVSSLLLATGCNRNSAGNTSGDRAAETDRRIETSAKDSYVFKTFLKDDSVTVKSTSGVVTLTGTVADDSRKSLAENTVANLSGVNGVNNQLKVKADSPAELSDAWLTLKVKTALMFRRSVNGITTEVSTENGTVTLSGEAANLAQKELATEYARDVEGVKAVKNEMTLAAAPDQAPQTVGETIDDASITAQVKASLLIHRSTSALKTKVQTTNGVVTLSGTARNAAEKTLATKLTTDIRGVRSVINNMTVATGAN